MKRRVREGVVSVVLVHTADEPVTEATLAALDSTAWPAGVEDVVVVDCEPHGIGIRAWAGRDDVDIVRLDEGTPYTEARNKGADLATGEYLAFLAASAVPERAWLERALEVLGADGSVACVAPHVPGAALGLSFDGRPTRLDAPAVGADVLFPSSDAMVLRTEVFRSSGGFVAEYERFGEEVELGWRLWLLGHRVRHLPDCRVRVNASSVAVAPHRRRFLEDRNALFTIFLHYERDTLATALPAAISLTIRRGTLAGGNALLDAARAVDAFAAAAPLLEQQRAAVQAVRQRPDSEVLRLFGAPLEASSDRRLQAVQEAMANVLGMTERFGQRRRVLVITADALTPRMTGAAIRAWQVASALSAEHDVQLATTSGRCDVAPRNFTAVAADDSELRLLEEWCDVVVLHGWILEGRPFLRDSRKVMVVDVHDPLHLEQLEQARDESDAVRRAAVRNATAVLNDQLIRGDFFICAGQKQRDFWLGQLAALGRINPLTYDESEMLDSLISVTPFGIPDDPPSAASRRALRGVVEGIGADDEVILWGGGIYNWFDPITLIEAVDRLKERRPKVRLFFMGAKHPDPDVGEMRMVTAARERSDELGLTDVHVFFNDTWVPYEERHEYLLDADVGVSITLEHVESAFSSRARILDYIWATLPIVATVGDELAELVAREALGLTVPAGDVGALEEALFRVLDEEEFAAMCRKNLAAVGPRFTWSQVLSPLVSFCRAPRRAPDLVDPEMSRELSVTADHERREWADELLHAARRLREGRPGEVARNVADRPRRRGKS